MIEKISTEDLKKFDEAAKGKFVKQPKFLRIELLE